MIYVNSMSTLEVIYYDGGLIMFRYTEIIGTRRVTTIRKLVAIKF